MQDEISFPGVFIDEPPSGVKAIEGVGTSTTGFIGRTKLGNSNVPVSITSFGDFTGAFGDLDINFPLTYTVRDFFQNGGGKAVIVRVCDPNGDCTKALDINSYLGDPGAQTGIDAFSKGDDINLLCIPPDTFGGDVPPAVYQAAMQFCADHGAMLLVDPPAAWSADGRTAARAASSGLANLGLTGMAARNAAIYFPRVLEEVPPGSGTMLETVASGVIAGVFARTDAEKGVWTAPAGVDAVLNGISGLELLLTDSDSEILNPEAINALRRFPGNIGNVIWGARTLRGADVLEDDYKFIPVRRLALFIESSLSRGLRWTVFEPNDQALWASIRLSAGNFMTGLFRQGAFIGASANESFFVKCDDTTTTQNDIEMGIVNVIIGFAPVRPAEFIVLNLQQLSAQPQ
jgi:uncharacterized protein